MAVFHDIKNEVHDISGLDNPSDWNFMKHKNVWIPVIPLIELEKEKNGDTREFIITKLLRKRDEQHNGVNSFDFVFKYYTMYRSLCEALDISPLQFYDWISKKINDSNDVFNNFSDT